MIEASIIGSTGYTGRELARLLLQKDSTGIKWYDFRGYTDQKYVSIYRSMFRIVGDACMDDNIEELADQMDMMFTAIPQGLCVSPVDENVLSKVKIIDLSADFRIKDVSVYEKRHKLTRASPRFIGEAVYGLPEINREKVKKARLVADPGCFPTYSFLSMYPLVKGGLIDPNTIIIDAKSGTSDAGRGSKADSLYCKINENIKAYGVASRGHTPETEGQLSCAAGKPVAISFTPRLVPINWGILVTAYAFLIRKVSYEEVEAACGKYCRDEYFVHVLEKGVVPQTQWVESSNFADVNLKIDTRANRVVMMGAIDNMIKGAIDQAIQDMNLMFGLPGNTRLRQIPIFP